MKTKQTKEGWWIIDGDTHVGKWIEECGDLAHDRFLIPLACANMRPGWIVMDCGALYGDHTIAYSRTVGGEGAVIAIEANKVAFECLSKNAQKFQSPVFCMNLALCEVHGGTAVHIMDESNVGASQVQNLNGSNQTEKEIRTASIDGIANDAGLQRLDFIKIDCEGWEYKILKGASEVLTKFKPIMLIEINTFALSQQDTCPKDVYDFLLEKNYSWRIVQPDCKGGDAQFDILCWPNNIEKLNLIKATRLI